MTFFFQNRNFYEIFSYLYITDPTEASAGTRTLFRRAEGSNRGTAATRRVSGLQQTNSNERIAHSDRQQKEASTCNHAAENKRRGRLIVCKQIGEGAKYQFSIPHQFSKYQYYSIEHHNNIDIFSHPVFSKLY